MGFLPSVPLVCIDNSPADRPVNGCLVRLADFESK
jgi:hypothetical protein